METRRACIFRCIVRFVVLAGLIPVVALAGARTGSSPSTLPARGHSVVVIGPKSPLFDTLLERWFPGVGNVNYFQQIRPLLAIVHNNTPRVLKAYVVKWTITNADGSTSTEYLPVMRGPAPDGSDLTGSMTVLGLPGTGLGTQLVSPFFHWPRRAFPSLLRNNAVMIGFQDANTKPLVSSVQGAAGVTAALDGAIFADGVFIGPDTSGLYERFQAEQQAEVDGSAWVLNEIKSGVTDEQLRDALTQQIYGGRNATGTDPSSLYAAARGEEASRLLGVLDWSGQAGLERAAGLLANATPMVLRKQAGP